MANVLREAADLLEADLVWSADLDAIRLDLAVLLRLESFAPMPRTSATKIAKTLVEDFSNELTVG